MTLRLGINGFGRIGRMVLRASLNRTDVEVVCINDLTSAESMAYSFEFDSTHGQVNQKVTYDKDSLNIGDKKIRLVNIKDPAQLPWKEEKVDIVIESTGLFLTQELASSHLKAGAQKVILSAPAKDNTPMYVYGVNHKDFNRSVDHIVSNASCTTNCLAPIVKVLLDNFGIQEGLMSTIHAVTSTQPTVDGVSRKDLRGGRSAMQNIIPSSTGAAKAVAACLPAVKGKLTGMSFRVPVANVSVVDLTVKLGRKTNYEEITQKMKEAAQGDLKGVLGICEKPLVSSDFIGQPYSSIYDVLAGIELNDTFFKIISWYDNEWGYSNRILDLGRYIFA